MAYESPISIVERITRSATEEVENSIVRTVSLHCDVTINKEELKKALDYDRQQYQQGYADAESIYKNKWIPVSERLPEDRKPVLVTAYWHETYQVMQASYFGNDMWWCVPFNNTGKHGQKLKPKAWMPLPEPYKEDE